MNYENAFETGNWKLETQLPVSSFDLRVSSFDFPVSDLQFPVSIFALRFSVLPGVLVVKGSYD
jgi:hypothetical protein